MVHEPPDLSSVPATLRHLIGSCLAKEPGHRPTMAHLLDRLAAFSAPLAETGEHDLLADPLGVHGLTMDPVAAALAAADSATARRSADSAPVLHGTGLYGTGLYGTGLPEAGLHGTGLRGTGLPASGIRAAGVPQTGDKLPVAGPGSIATGASGARPTRSERSAAFRRPLWRRWRPVVALAGALALAAGAGIAVTLYAGRQHTGRPRVHRFAGSRCDARHEDVGRAAG